MTVAGDFFSSIVAGGIVVAFLFQVFVNVGMTMGVAPVTGIPLPFVTVGGSSMVANLLAIGVLQGIHARGALPLETPLMAALRPGAVFSLVRELRKAAKETRPLQVSGILAAQLAREPWPGATRPSCASAATRRTRPCS